MSAITRAVFGPGPSRDLIIAYNRTASIPKTNVSATARTAKPLPGGVRFIRFMSASIWGRNKIAFRVNSPALMMKPATRPPSRTRGKLILAILVASGSRTHPQSAAGEALNSHGGEAVGRQRNQLGAPKVRHLLSL